MTNETPAAPPAMPTVRAPRSIPMELTRDAGLFIGTLAALLLLRWAFQHHVPDGNDAQLLWLFLPFYLIVDWWKLARARRAGAPGPQAAD